MYANDGSGIGVFRITDDVGPMENTAIAQVDTDALTLTFTREPVTLLNPATWEILDVHGVNFTPPRTFYPPLDGVVS